MKKLLFVIIISLLVISIFSCGSNNEPIYTEYTVSVVYEDSTIDTVFFQIGGEYRNVYLNEGCVTAYLGKNQKSVAYICNVRKFKIVKVEEVFRKYKMN